MAKETKEENQKPREEKLSRPEEQIRARCEDTMEIIPVPANAPEIDW